LSEAGKSGKSPEPEEESDAIDAEVEIETPAPDAQAAAIALAERVNELESELAQAKDERLRALAEAENARRRAQKDREEANRYGATGLARDVVSVADNLGRALAAMPTESDSEAIKNLAAGVEMVEKELSQALAKHGVKTVGEVGDQFDPNTCQAVFEMESAEIPAGHIAQVMQKGYMLYDRLIRPAMVGVAKATSEIPEAADKESDDQVEGAA
jgi:molecular chaperone GrpE